MQVPNITEKLLVARLRKKDPEALAKIYDTYVGPLYRFVYFKVPTQQDAEDLTSELFLKFWNYATSVEEEIINVRALLYRMARNMVVDFYRSRSQAESFGDDETLDAIPDKRQTSFFEQVEIRIEVDSLEPVLRRMKDDYREVIVLRYVEQLSVGEISAVLSKSKGAVRVLLSRALKVARDLIQEQRNAPQRQRQKIQEPSRH